MFVQPNNYKSSLYFSNSGVPKGSNREPLLFPLIMNYIISDADNLKLFKKITSVP